MSINERKDCLMATTTLEEWAEAHGPAAARVAKRIERFASNTTDPATSLAAEELLEMMGFKDK